MQQFLEFTFDGIWHFVGVYLLISTIGAGIVGVVKMIFLLVVSLRRGR